MPKFIYTALDARGQHSRGEVEAESADQAVRELSSRGLRLSSIQVEQGLPVASAPRPPAGIPPPTTPSLPAIRYTRTRPLRDSQAHFMFAQLAMLAKAGVNPHDALARVAAGPGPACLKSALGTIARDVAAGDSLAASMAKFPDLFEPSALGAVEAGERGGYLPEALLRLSDQYKTKLTLKRYLWYARATAYAAIPAVPFGIALGRSFEPMAQALDHPGRPTMGLELLLESLVRSALGPLGWVTLAVLIGFVGFEWWLSQTGSRKLRHRWGASLFLRGRALSESVAAFLWHLGKLSAVGLSPQRSWEIAARAVPNESISQQLKRAEASGEASPLSELLGRSGLTSSMEVSTVAIAETTGSMHEALEYLSAQHRAELERADVGLKAKLGCWPTLGGLLVGAIAVLAFYLNYVPALVRGILGE